MDPKLREAFRFHLQHSGYCRPPGRAACALARAKVEQIARDLNLRVEWEYEDDLEPDFDDDGEALRKIHSGEWEWLRAAVLTPDGECLGSLGGISCVPGDGYRRVVEADLYLEAIGALRDRLEGV